ATSWHSSSRSANSLPPFAMWPAFPTSDYYGGSAPAWRHQATTALPVPTWLVGGRSQAVPVFTAYRLTEEVPSFSPAASPASTPQLFLAASGPSLFTGFGVALPSGRE